MSYRNLLTMPQTFRPVNEILMTFCAVDLSVLLILAKLNFLQLSTILKPNCPYQILG